MDPAICFWVISCWCGDPRWESIEMVRWDAEKGSTQKLVDTHMKPGPGPESSGGSGDSHQSGFEGPDVGRP